jgi:hypothetical protein
MAMDRLSDVTRQEMEELAAEHDTFESFLQDMQRYAELAWGNARSKRTFNQNQPHEHLTGTRPPQAAEEWLKDQMAPVVAEELANAVGAKRRPARRKDGDA